MYNCYSTDDASGTIVQQRPHCRRLKSRRAKPHNDRSHETSSGSKSREKCSVKKRRRGSVPMLRTSVVGRHEGVQAAETPERVRSRLVTSGPTLRRSNQSEKWQQVCVSLGVESSQSVTTVWCWCESQYI